MIQGLLMFLPKKLGKSERKTIHHVPVHEV